MKGRRCGQFRVESGRESLISSTGGSLLLADCAGRQPCSGVVHGVGALAGGAFDP